MRHGPSPRAEQNGSRILPPCAKIHIRSGHKYQGDTMRRLSARLPVRPRVVGREPATELCGDIAGSPPPLDSQGWWSGDH